MNNSKIKSALIDIIDRTVGEIKSLEVRLDELKYYICLDRSVFRSVIDVLIPFRAKLSECEIADTKSNFEYALDIRDAIRIIRSRIMSRSEIIPVTESLNKLNLAANKLCELEGDGEPIGESDVILPFCSGTPEAIKSSSADELACSLYVLTEVAKDADYIISIEDRPMLDPADQLAIFLKKDTFYISLNRRLDLLRSDIDKLRANPMADDKDLEKLHKDFRTIEALVEQYLESKKKGIATRHRKALKSRETLESIKQIAAAYIKSSHISYKDLALIAVNNDLSICKLFCEYSEAYVDGDRERISEISLFASKILDSLKSCATYQ